MSTRSCIARKTGPNTFVGVYHHWDGYPSALGATLFELYNIHFEKDLEKMLAFLIDQHPAGWRTINGKDLTLEPGFQDDQNAQCISCGLENWKHYSQYYERHGLGEFIRNIKPGIYQMFDHSFQPDRTKAEPPECYCHGARNEEGNQITETDDAGMEWAYVFDPEVRVMYVLERLYGGTTQHMTGMFGMGAPNNQHWAFAAFVNLDGVAPDWEKVSAQQAV